MEPKIEEKPEASSSYSGRSSVIQPRQPIRSSVVAPNYYSNDKMEPKIVEKRREL